MRTAPGPTRKPVRILLLEDSEADAELCAMEIMRSVSPTTPFIIVADAITGAQSVGAIRAGV